MTIIVETGAIVTGANSYASRADYIAYAASVGVTVADDATADVQLIKAAAFIDSHERRLIGYRKTRDQPMSYPRDELVIESWEWQSNEIPRQVILCQLSTALDIKAGIDPYNPPANPARAVRREKIDLAVDVEYFGSDAGAKMSSDSTSRAMLNTLLKNSGMFAIPLVRA